MSVLEQDSRKKLTLGHDSNTLVLLIVFNAIAFVILSFFNITYLLTNSTEDAYRADVLYYCTVPASFDVFLTRPWTLVTFMFSHGELLQLVANVLWLWCFGFILNDLVGNKKLIPLYIYGGLAGALFFLVSANAVPFISKNVNSYYPLIGAGPSVMAVAVASTYLSPRFRIFPRLKGGLPIWVLCLVYVFISLFSAYNNNLPNLLAIAGGGIIGLVIAWQLKKGNDLGKWMNDFVGWINDLFNPEKIEGSDNVKSELFYKADVPPFVKKPKPTQEKIDELLDKINLKGYNSLTQEEKDFLKNASKEEL